jgi:hypothetical protein
VATSMVTWSVQSSVGSSDIIALCRDVPSVGLVEDAILRVKSSVRPPEKLERGLTKRVSSCRDWGEACPA